MSVEPTKTTIIPPRPQRRDAHLIAVVADRLAEMLQPEYMGVPVETLKQDLTEALRWGHPYDGYDLGKELDNEGYEMRAAVVEILDSAEGILSEALEAAVGDWVKAYDVKPRLKKDDVVQWKGEQGTIVAAHYDYMPGYYVLALPGHNQIANGIAGGLLLPWEELEAENAALLTAQSVEL